MIDVAWEVAYALKDNAFILMVLMVIDIITGLVKGTKDNSLRSTIMSLGIRKKGAMLIGITFSIVVDLMLFDGTPTFSTMMILLVMANEALSVTENLTQLGVPIPKFITKRLEVMKEKNSIEETQNDLTVHDKQVSPMASDADINKSMDVPSEQAVPDAEEQVPENHQEKHKQ